MSDNRMNFPYEGNEEQQHKSTNGFGVPSDGGWGVSSSRKEEKNQAEPAGQSSGEGSQGAQPATPLAGQASQPAAGPSYGQQEQNTAITTPRASTAAAPSRPGRKSPVSPAVG